MNKTKLYSKLLKIQQEVDKFVKDATSFGYNYVSGNQVLGKIRPLMNELGLLLKQEVIEIENQRMDYTTGRGGQKSEILTKTIQKFTWIDVETGEKEECMFGANGMNDWEKGLGSALTYAERYFLLKFFHVPTDEDDIDNPNRKENTFSTGSNGGNNRNNPSVYVWLTEEQFKKLIETGDKELIKKYLARYNGQVHTDGKVYAMRKAFRDKLMQMI